MRGGSGPRSEWNDYNAGVPGLASARGLAVTVAHGTRRRPLYDEDFWSWTQREASALRRRDPSAIDWENVTEEIEALGRREQRGWTSPCGKVIRHLLKMEHSRRRESVKHWRDEIEAWRETMFRRLQRSKGLRGRLDEMLDEAWWHGRRLAVTDLVKDANPTSWAAEKALRRSWEQELPEDCPYALEDIAGYDPRIRDKKAEPNRGIWPAAVATRMNEELGWDYEVRR